MAKTIRQTPKEIPLPDKFPDSKPYHEPEEPDPSEWDPDSLPDEDPVVIPPDNPTIPGEGP